MKRKWIPVCYSLIMFLLIQSQCAIKAQDETTKTQVTTTIKVAPGANLSVFRQGADVEPNAAFSPQAFAPRPSGLMALLVTFSKRGANARGEEIWIAEPDGKRPRRVVKRVQGRIRDIQWSPDGARLSYRIEAQGPEKGLYIAQV